MNMTTVSGWRGVSSDSFTVCAPSAEGSAKSGAGDPIAGVDARAVTVPERTAARARVATRRMGPPSGIRTAKRGDLFEQVEQDGDLRPDSRADRRFAVGREEG